MCVLRMYPKNVIVSSKQVTLLDFGLLQERGWQLYIGENCVTCVGEGDYEIAVLLSMFFLIVCFHLFMKYIKSMDVRFLFL